LHKAQENSGKRLLQCGKAVLLGGVAALAVCVVLLLLVSFAISSGLLDPSVREQAAVVACVLGSFFGGLFAVRISPAQRLLTGVATGGVLFLLQISLGLLSSDTASVENGGLGFLCGALCAGAAAGILGSGKPKKGSGRAHRRRPH